MSVSKNSFFRHASNGTRFAGLPFEGLRPASKRTSYPSHRHICQCSSISSFLLSVDKPLRWVCRLGIICSHTCRPRSIFTDVHTAGENEFIFLRLRAQTLRGFFDSLREAATRQPPAGYLFIPLPPVNAEIFCPALPRSPQGRTKSRPRTAPHPPD